MWVHRFLLVVNVVVAMAVMLGVSAVPVEHKCTCSPKLRHHHRTEKKKKRKKAHGEAPAGKIRSASWREAVAPKERANRWHRKSGRIQGRGTAQQPHNKTTTKIRTTAIPDRLNHLAEVAAHIPRQERPHGIRE